LALLMWALVYAGFYDRLGAVWAQTRLPVLAALLVSFVTFAFYTCVGLIVDRLAYAVVPPLVVVAGLLSISVVRQSDSKSKNLFVSGCVLIALMQLVHVVVKDGPWS